MKFHPGDSVHVAALGKGVVREVRNAGRYLVEIKGRSVLLHGDQLEAIDSPKKRGAAASAPSPEEAGSVEHRPASLDLHGMTVQQAADALDAFVNDALLAGYAEARVIHGRSGGRIRSAVHARLRQISSVRSFRIDPRNAGVTIVTF